jgi:DNA-binding response OmpR family regulator
LQIRKAVLDGAGFAVRTAMTADEALISLRSNVPDVVITDHVLPGASGADFVRQLRTVEPDVPVVVVSGMAEAEDEYAGLNVTFRQKPYPAPQLIALVQELANPSPPGSR